jgi:hypothetical protein
VSIGKGIQQLGQLDVVSNRFAIAFAASLPQRQPDFEGPETSRVLHPDFVVIDSGLALLVEEVVIRIKTECILQRPFMLRDDTCGFNWAIQPLVRIHCDGIHQ